jgi:peptidoglycan/LPS O-acetylase OafA/YrhL
MFETRETFMLAQTAFRLRLISARRASLIMNRRVIELDGLRGLAALAVIVAHYFGEVAHGFRIFTFGWLGVDVFFVLSGYLIGSLILEQQSQPGFLGVFYLKRAARIIPVYAAVCAVTLCAAAITAGHTWSDRPFYPAVYARSPLTSR